MIYLVNNEIYGIKVGDIDIPGIYAGDTQMYPTNFEGIKVSPSSITSKISGGTFSLRVKSDREWALTKNETWFSLSPSSGSGNTVVTVTVDANNTGSARTDTITATTTDNLYSATTVLDQIICAQVPLLSKIGTANNQGYTKNGIYCMDSGLTEITSCDFDFTGIKSICARDDAFYTSPSIAFGIPKVGTLVDTYGSLQTIERIDIDCTGIETLNFMLGTDRPSQTCQTCTAVTLTNTDSVKTMMKTFSYCQSLKTLNLGSLANVTQFKENNIVRDCTGLENITIQAWPKMNIIIGLDSCTALTETSIINVLNALPSNANNTLTIGSTNKNKLTSAEGIAALAAAQNKGWTVN